jgi:trans-aconitate methyltransferase
VSLLEIIRRMRAAFAAGASTFELDVLDPDLARGRHAGEQIVVGGTTYVHRPLRVWIDLAERMRLRLKTPRPASPPFIHLVFEPLATDAPVHASAHGDATEKYGADSAFARVSKLDDPSFVLDMADALERIEPQAGARVLSLGVNTGDELALLLDLAPALRDATFVGIDHSASAIAAARERFGATSHGTTVGLHVADITAPGELAALDLGRFDLVIAIGLLQSGAIDDRALLRTLVQDHLAPHGSLILGIPNCRYVDGEVEYGARMKNFTQPELGLVIKDIAFYRKYLQQHHKKVFVTGKHYLLVTAIP